MDKKYCTNCILNCSNKANVIACSGPVYREKEEILNGWRFRHNKKFYFYCPSQNELIKLDSME